MVTSVNYKVKGQRQTMSFDITILTCKPFGFYHGDRVEVSREKGTVIGCRNGMMWVHFDSENGAISCESRTEEQFKEKGMRVIKAGAIRKQAKYLVFYKNNEGYLKGMNTSYMTCAPYGFFYGDRVLTPDGKAMAIGVFDNRFWFLLDKNQNASYWNNLHDYDDFKEKGFKLLEIGSVRKQVTACMINHFIATGERKFFDISKSKCSPFGHFYMDRVSTPRGMATVVGVCEGNLWFHFDSDNGAKFWKDGAVKETFDDDGFVFVEAGTAFSDKKTFDVKHSSQGRIELPQEISRLKEIIKNLFIANEDSIDVGSFCESIIPENDSDMLVSIIKKLESWKARQTLLSQLAPELVQEDIIEIANNDSDPDVVLDAVKLIDSSLYAEELAQIAIKTDSSDVRNAVYEKMDPKKDALHICAIVKDVEDSGDQNSFVALLDGEKNTPELIDICLSGRVGWKTRQSAVSNMNPDGFGEEMVKLALSEDDDDVLNKIIEKLKECGNYPAVALIGLELQRSSDLQYVIQHLNRDINYPVLEQIVLDSTDWEIRLEALKALDPAKSHELIEFMKNEDDDSDVQSTAEKMLENADLNSGSYDRDESLEKSSEEETVDPEDDESQMQEDVDEDSLLDDDTDEDDIILGLLEIEDDDISEEDDVAEVEKEESEKDVVVEPDSAPQICPEALLEIEKVKKLIESNENRDLAKMVLNSKYPEVRIEIIGALEDFRLLEKIAQRDFDEKVKLAALAKFDPENHNSQLSKIAEKGSGKIQLKAIKMLDTGKNLRLLKKLSTRGSDAVKKAVLKKIKE